MAKLALGKGLDALIPVRHKEHEDSMFIMLETEQVSARRAQPRQFFSDERIKELADSIREKGMLQPLLVKRNNGTFELIAGERRLRAAQMIGLPEVPAIVMNAMTDSESFQLALIENIQREDLTPLEEAKAYTKLLESGALTQEELASRLGKDRSTIANSIRLLTLPEEVKDLVNEGKISASHARAILALPDAKAQVEVATTIAESNVSVRRIEEMVYGKPRKKRGRSLKLKRRPPEIYEAETALKQYLRTAVRVKRGLKEGRIEISFYSEDDLSRLLDLILGQRKEEPRSA
jgi:ParB family chromosome partitioning protein